MASIIKAEGAEAAIGRANHRPRITERSAAHAVGFDRGDTRSLSTLIQSEIIPRLMVAHAADRPEACPTIVAAPIEPDDVETLVELALRVEAEGLLRHVEAIIARGVAIDAILVDLLAPAARLLGEYWETDRNDFLDVTMALWRLQEAVHELATRLPPDRSGTGGGHRALFASMPGDQHSFGTVVIDELFRREGWLTTRVSDADTKDLLRLAANEWFDLIGLTVSCDCHISGLASIIAALRNVSRNPRVCVMVGGRVFGADPDLASRIGADGTAQDARLALTLASGLVTGRGSVL